MTRQLLYVACPLTPSEAAIRYAEASAGPHLPSWGVSHQSIAIQQNIHRALRWLAWLRKSFPETTFIAPWIAAVMSGEDNTDPKAREAGLVDDCAVIERCDGIVLCGGRISSGMRREMEHYIDSRVAFHVTDVKVYDLTGLGRDVPAGVPEFALAPGRPTFSDYMDAYRESGELEGLGR